MADKHAVLELGDADLQFSSHDYSTQVVLSPDFYGIVVDCLFFCFL